MDAIAPADAVTFDFRTLSARDRYKLMIGTVVPRPIALVTTVDVIDVDRMRIDPAKLDTIARLGGNTCSTIRDRFEMPTPTLADFDAA
jgi:hypothetical protein